MANQILDKDGNPIKVAGSKKEVPTLATRRCIYCNTPSMRAVMVASGNYALIKMFCQNCGSAWGDAKIEAKYVNQKVDNLVKEYDRLEAPGIIFSSEVKNPW